MFKFLIKAFLWISISVILPAVFSGGPLYGDDFEKYEDRVMKCFYDGDYYKLYNEIEKLLFKFPDNPGAYLYFYDPQRLIEVRGAQGVEDTLKGTIERLEANNKFKYKNIYLLALRLELEKLLYMIRPGDAEKISSSLFPVRKWALLGPYSKYGYADLDYPFLPELTTRIDSIKEGKIVSLKDPGGRMKCGRFLNSGEGVIYAVTTVGTGGAPVKLRIYSGADYKLFINGKEILTNSRRGTFRNHRVIKVWGTNYITIMLKLYKAGSRSFRLLVTDENDILIEAPARVEKMFFTGYNFLEELDYPFSYFLDKSNGDAQGSFSLGNYFDELNSREAIKHYKNSLKGKNFYIKKFFLASSMIEYSGGNKNSALYMNGWRLVEELAGKKNLFLFAPLQHLLFKKQFDRGDYIDAYSRARTIIKNRKNFFPLRLNFIKYLKSMGYDREFEIESEKLIHDFPESIEALKIKALYCLDKDVQKSIEIYNTILASRRDRDVLKSLIDIFKHQGEFNKARLLISKYDYNNDFSDELIELYIQMGDLKNARDQVLKQLAKKQDPYLYIKMGQISLLNDADPLMYFGKSLSIDPSAFNLSDYIDYYENERLIPPLFSYSFHDIESEIKNASSGCEKDDGACILLRERIYLLNKDGGSRAFFQDLIHLRDEKNIDKWGEYQVPSAGNFYPVRIRVYHEDGSFTDSYNIEKVNGRYFINISTLNINSTLHIAYYLDYPVVDPGKSTFSSIPFTLAQQYDEPVKRFMLKVITPEEMKLNLMTNSKAGINKKSSSGKNIYSLELKDLKSKQYEQFSGNKLNNLPFYAFSTIEKMKDFVLWYKGLIKDYIEPGEEILKKFSKGNVSEKIEDVYNFVSREIDLQGNILYYPDRAEDVFFAKKGTVEDKVLLAKSILDGLGIMSFIAFAKKSDLPDTGNLVSPSMFGSILLYVPLSRDRAKWFDFSSQFYPCGVIDERITGSEAVVIVGNDYEIKKIDDVPPDNKSAIYRVKLKKNGINRIEIELKFSGTSGDIRQYFRNKIYREDVLNRYVGEIVPSISIDDYKIENFDNYNNPFMIRIKGETLANTITGNKLLLKPIINKCSIYNYIKYAKRDMPLSVENSIIEDDIYIYLLPDSYINSELNKNHQIKNKYGTAEIIIKKEKGSRELTASKKILVKKQKILQSDYLDFLNFCLLLKGYENQDVVLSP